MTGQLPLTMMETNFDQTLKTAKLKMGREEDSQRQRQKEERDTVLLFNYYFRA